MRIVDRFETQGGLADRQQVIEYLEAALSAKVKIREAVDSFAQDLAKQGRPIPDVIMATRQELGESWSILFQRKDSPEFEEEKSRIENALRLVARQAHDAIGVNILKVVVLRRTGIKLDESFLRNGDKYDRWLVAIVKADGERLPLSDDTYIPALFFTKLKTKNNGAA